MQTMSFDAGGFAPASSTISHRSSSAAEASAASAPADESADIIDPWEATLSGPIALSGRGLHTGKRSTVLLLPAPSGTGVVFRRFFKTGPVELPALLRHQTRQPLCTALGQGSRVHSRTIEHLLAALTSLGIDNVVVEHTAEELPIFDGSAARWCEGIRAAGRTPQGARRRKIRVLETVRYQSGKSVMRIEPSRVFSLDVQNALKGFGQMRWTGPVTRSTFIEQLAPSRSFGRIKWGLPAKLHGHLSRTPVLRGAYPGSVAMIWGGRVLGGMRVPQEPVRHRALDLIGDLALAGAPIVGHVTALNPGHDSNIGLLRTLMDCPSAWVLEA